MFFKVHDRGKGRIALEAMNGTGFLTVVGAGLSADVRMMERRVMQVSFYGKICFVDNVCSYP